jgi:acetolactate synthase regulatory subunit
MEAPQDLASHLPKEGWERIEEDVDKEARNQLSKAPDLLQICSADFAWGLRRIALASMECQKTLLKDKGKHMLKGSTAPVRRSGRIGWPSSPSAIEEGIGAEKDEETKHRIWRIAKRRQHKAVLEKLATSKQGNTTILKALAENLIVDNPRVVKTLVNQIPHGGAGRPEAKMLAMKLIALSDLQSKGQPRAQALAKDVFKLFKNESLEETIEEWEKSHEPGEGIAKSASQELFERRLRKVRLEKLNAQTREQEI